MLSEALVNLPKVFDKQAGQCEEIGTVAGDSYFTIFAQIVFLSSLVEATDEELMYLVEKSGALSFWESAEEDVYTLEDGSPLQ